MTDSNISKDSGMINDQGMMITKIKGMITDKEIIPTYHKIKE